MGDAQKSALDRIVFSPWPLLGLLVLLAVCWWTLPFNLLPNLKLPVPAYCSPSEFNTSYEGLPLDSKLGYWIASKGWDAGPPSEYPYDFILSWHLTLSVLVYLGIFGLLQTKARKNIGPFRLADFLSARMVKFLFLYPVPCTLIVWVCPWKGEDIFAHKIFGLLIYAPLFCSLTLIALGSLGKRVPQILIWTVCCIVAALSFWGPYSGRGLDIMITLVMTLAVTVWALATSKGHLARIRQLLAIQFLDQRSK